MAQERTQTCSTVAQIAAWGGISKKREYSVVLLYKYKGCPFYVTILQNQLLPAAENMYGRSWRLQQDNDPKHTSRVGKDFIAEMG
jgi:hypothetical protein